jgi:hypothetical protein
MTFLFVVDRLGGLGDSLGPCSLRQRSIERLLGYPIQVCGPLHNYPALMDAGGNTQTLDASRSKPPKPAAFLGTFIPAV